MAVLWFVFMAMVGLLMAKAYNKWQNQEETNQSRLLLGLSSVIMLWLFCELIMQLTTNASAIIFFHEFKYIAILSTPGMLYAYSVEIYYERPNRLPSVILLSIIPVIFIVLIFTNSYHHLFRHSLEVILGSINYVDVDNNVLYYLTVIYVYLGISSSVILLIKHFKAQPVIYRNRVGILIFSIIGTSLLNVLYQFMQIKYSLIFDFTPVAFGVIAWLVYYAAYVYIPDNVTHIAKNFILDQLDVGVLFLDRENKIYYGNQYLCDMIEKKDASMIRKSVYDLPQPISHAIETAKSKKEEVQLRMVAFEQLSVFMVSRQVVRDQQDRLLGTLVFFKNVTEEEQRITQLEFEHMQDRKVQE